MGLGSNRIPKSNRSMAITAYLSNIDVLDHTEYVCSLEPDRPARYKMLSIFVNTFKKGGSDMVLA